MGDLNRALALLAPLIANRSADTPVIFWEKSDLPLEVLRSRYPGRGMTEG
jgi:hypothetical protein